jgi:hypothetical protein
MAERAPAATNRHRARARARARAQESTQEMVDRVTDADTRFQADEIRDDNQPAA